MLNLFENKGRKVKIRYYAIKIFDLYHYKIYSGLRLDYYSDRFM